ncbi:MAG: iron uptake porin [Oscillatoria sp. SIO1A7]|nr:iron uptake porin [Oscillatoria sp. SIO1A7]
MSRLLWQGLRISPGVISAVLLLSSPAIAQELATESFSNTQETGRDSFSESSLSSLNTAPSTDSTDNLLKQLDQYSQVNLSLQSDPLELINSVDELSDVRPTDWAYSALRGLAERYGCLLGYQDGTYRGNRAMTRYEFAAGLDECMNVMQRLIEDATSEIGSGDLDVIARLQEEFAAELATMRARVDGLEVRTAELEANQFSTTTKLKGEAIFALVDAFGESGDTINGGEDVETAFGYRVRMNFDTSFTGKDRLRTRLQALNVPPLDDATGTRMTRLGFDGSESSQFTLNRLDYRFPLSDKARLNIGAQGFSPHRFASVTNPLLASSGSGALSRFARRNPLIFRTPSGGGIGLEYKLSDALMLDLGYFAGDAESPTPKNGLFNGAYSAFAQATITPTENIELSLSYVNSYHPGGGVNLTGSTGSSLARRPFGNVATSANHFAVGASVDLNPVVISGWGGFLTAEAQDGPRQDDNADIWTWMVNFGVPDVGKKGSVLALVVGQPPKLTDVDGGDTDPDTSLHFEALYRYPIAKKIAITPGVIVITNPEHNSDNETIVVGTVRTTFKF